MSVTHPLLKKLKGFIISLRSKDETVTDINQLLQPVCETIEWIFFYGLQASTSWFGQPKTEYWAWISKIQSLPDKNRLNSMLLMTIEAAKKNNKTHHDIGRGRCFIRSALNKKLLTILVQLLKSYPDFRRIWYTDCDSILGNEILSEILLSLLLELQAVEFKLQLKNSSFLDVTWELPVYKQYELVPSQDLGLDIRRVHGYPLVTQVDPNSVAGEDGKVLVGDVLDEMCGECLRGVGKSGVYFIYNQYENKPIQMSVMKGKGRDGNVYGPIGRLMDLCDLGELSPATPTSPISPSPWEESHRQPPPEALLPEEIEDRIPVHNSDGSAVYETVYLGKAALGKDGRVDLVEFGVANVLSQRNESQTVLLELGEKDVTVTNKASGQVVVQHLFTEISACGRRTDTMKYYAFIAGETYCSLAERFMCHVFEAKSEEEAKMILRTIAQGFERTHLMT
ncbi:hypothetical protein DPMN_034655 [Dreissena polymorpha]|uniref:PID domain-containing protein n=3 Tax=Dreissena polymorpha TaxID=45954 RepID=A0A9D4RL66_DREPO|nr:hypothetical protein DPMN_034655 [Dreissena polymorpha]